MSSSPHYDYHKNKHWMITRPLVPLRCFTRKRLVTDFARVRMDYDCDTDHTYLKGKMAGRVVEQIARYFRREFDYNLPYDTDKHQRTGDTTLHPYVFFDYDNVFLERQYAIGACSFQFVQFADIGDRWELAWIWLHPYMRRRGHLSKAWPFFIQQYGDFVVQHPLSSAMEAFLRKIMPSAIQEEGEEYYDHSTDRDKV